MTQPYTRLPVRLQPDMVDPPYDTWRNPNGGIAAEFYRMPFGYLVRFPDEADFEIDARDLQVLCRPAPREKDTSDKLFHNSLVPLLANYCGGLNLHASAVAVEGRAVAFLGASRRGKTTLAGAFAKAGYPFLTEDVLDLEPVEGHYIVRPSRPELRLLGDSAAFLLGDAAPPPEEDDKRSLKSGDALPYRREPAHLGALFVLGPGTAPAPAVERLSPAQALAELIQHAFVLDVEDRARLRAHFSRIGTLTERVSCYRLDYPRRYEQLGVVIETVTRLSDLTRQR